MKGSGQLEVVSRRDSGPLVLNWSEGRAPRVTARRVLSGSALVRNRAGVRAFTRQAGTLLRAGFPLDRVLSMTGDILPAGPLAEAIRNVQERVRHGESLAVALTAQPGFFNEFYRGVITAGERSGQLTEAFEGLADYLDTQAELRARLLGALLYPAIMVCAGSAAVLLLLLVVIPRFVVILADVGGQLPWTASALLSLADVAGSVWWVAAILAVCLGAAFRIQRRVPTGRLRQDQWLLRLPVLGSLRARLATERVTRTLASALGSGIRLLEALDIAGTAAGDAAFRRELNVAAEEIRRGERLSVVFERGGILPKLAVQMIAAGEESGRLVPMLEHVANVYRSETEQQLRSLVAVVEPAVIVVFGGLVGLVALALLQTIYGIGTTL